MVTAASTLNATLVSEPPPVFLDWLVAQNRLTAPVAERVARVHTETADRLASVLLKLGLMSEADLAALLCEFVKGERLLESHWPAEPVTLTQLIPDSER